MAFIGDRKTFFSKCLKIFAGTFSNFCTPAFFHLQRLRNRIVTMKVYMDENSCRRFSMIRTFYLQKPFYHSIPESLEMEKRWGTKIFRNLEKFFTIPYYFKFCWVSFRNQANQKYNLSIQMYFFDSFSLGHQVFLASFSEGTVEVLTNHHKQFFVLDLCFSCCPSEILCP